MAHKMLRLAALGALAFLAFAVEIGPRQAVAAAGDPVIAAAGDIACDLLPTAGTRDPDERGPNVCHMAATAQLIKTLNPAAVLALGDEQYADGRLDQFEAGYAKSWGAFKDITRPTPGNHEYHTPGAAGYYGYFGPAAGDPSKGYYSFDLGGWHLIALNGNCKAVGGCAADSPQTAWLVRDLADHHACTLAYWHQPRFSSGAVHGNDAAYDPFWRALYAAHADIVLAGHDHEYERFAPQTPDEALDTKAGITEFVVGTGGRSHYHFGAMQPNSKASTAETYGILALTLHAHVFDWRFIPEPGSTFTDSGSQSCHG